MERIVLGIDCSTTGCKVIAWDRIGRALGESRAVIPTLTSNPGWYEQDATRWWDATTEAIQRLGAQIDLGRTASLCITHQRESFVPVSEDGTPLRHAILWLDERSRQQVEWLDAAVGGEAVHTLTGKPLSMIPSLPKIAWLRDNEPDVLRRADRVLDTHAFLVHRLTGRFATSLASADPMGIVDIGAGLWAEDLAGEVGLRMNQLPDLFPPGSQIGTVTAEAAEATGLPRDLPVIAGGGDGQCAGLGANAVRDSSPYLNMGTAVVAGALSDVLRIDRSYRTLCAPIPGHYYLETCLKGGVFTVGWFVERFAPDLAGRTDPESILEQEAAAVSPGCQGLVVVPYWHNVLNPYWDPSASGITVGWTGNHGRAHFYRAILEGVAFEQRLAGDGVMQSLGLGFDRYLTMGGGSRSPLWCQILADITGVEIRRTTTSEATCLGAGILAAVAAGWYDDPFQAAAAMTSTDDGFHPDADRARLYDSLYRDVYRKLYPALRKPLNRLTELSETRGE